MEFRLIWIPIVAGGVATLGMTGLLYLINWTGWANADMVRAVGGLFTKRDDTAMKTGLIIHITAGIIVSGIYLHMLSLFNPPGFIALIVISGIMGFVHGFVFSFVMVITAENHPIDKFRQADFHVAVAHVMAHVFYGMLVGTMFGLLRISGVDVDPGIMF